jgi:signal recognition particle subunit SRP54
VSVTDVNQLLERFVQAQKMMGQMAGSMGLPGMGPMSKKARGRQMQAQARGKGKKGKGGKGKGGPARRPMGAPGGLPGGLPGGGFPGGMPSLPPGQGLPDLSQLNFDQFKDDRGR